MGQAGEVVCSMSHFSPTKIEWFKPVRVLRQVGGDIVVSTETRERAETAAAASEDARDQAQVYAANTVE